MKTTNAPLRKDQRTAILTWIAHSTEFFITCLPGHDQADIDAGIQYAVNAYLNREQTPGSAIPAGVLHARQRIKHRQSLALCRGIALQFLAHTRHSTTGG